jgi:hypothetical protein
MFFDRFRRELQKYADGVHVVEDPAPERAIAETEARLGGKLPAGLASLYASWNGVRLFVETIEIVPVEQLEREGALWRVGHALGAPLFVDERGRVIGEDEEGDRVVVGSSVEAWLGAVMAREGLLVDREGEYKDVFVDDEGGLKEAVQKRRVRAAVKADPDAAAWRIEEAEEALEAGALDDAEAALRRAVALDEGAGAAWALLGALLRARLDAATAGGEASAPALLDEIEAAFARAATVARDPGRRAERWAEAARAAREAGRDGRAHIAAAREADAGAAARWLTEAEVLADEGDVDGALQRARLAAALEETPGPAAALASRLRARRSLRVV